MHERLKKSTSMDGNLMGFLDMYGLITTIPNVNIKGGARGIPYYHKLQEIFDCGKQVEVSVFARKVERSDLPRKTYCICLNVHDNLEVG